MAKQSTKIEETAKNAAKAKVKEAAAQAARETVLSLSEEDGETTDFLASDKDIAGDITEFGDDSDANRDIFADIGEERVKKGDIIKYTIFKYGSQLTSVFHPCSWDMIHKKFGDGQYKVIARSSGLNRIVKTQSRMLGQPPAEFSLGGFGTQDAATDKEAVVQQPQQPAQPTLFEMITLMNQMQSQAKQEAREITNQGNSSSDKMMMMFMEMMKSTNENAMKAQLASAETIAKVTEKITENQNKMFEQINARIEKVLESKNKGIDTETLMEKMMKSQLDGFELYKKMDELATKKAETQIELLEAARGDDDDVEPAQKESTIDVLIKSIIPLMASGQLKMPQTFQESPQPRGQLPQARRQPGPRQQAGRNVGQGVRSSQQPTGSSQIQKGSAAADQTIIDQGGGATSEGFVNPEENIVKMRGGIPEVDVTTVVNDAEEQNESFESSEEKIVPLRDKVRDILPGFLGGLMLEGVAAEDALPKTLVFFDEHGIGLTAFVQEITAQDLIDVANEYALPEASHPWLNELYANLQDRAGTLIGRERPVSQQPENSVGL